MVDPLAIATGTVAGQAAAILRDRIAESFKGDTTDRLFRLLDRRFGAHTGLTLSQLRSWADDELSESPSSSSDEANGTSTDRCCARPCWASKHRERTGM